MATETDNHGSAAAPITIRDMELEDLPAVYALGEQLFTSELWPNLYRTWDVYELVDTFSSDSETCFVAEADDQLVGFILGTVIEKRRSAWNYGYIVWIGVDPTVKRRGIGRRLMDRITASFVRHGVRILLLDTDANNYRALAFFEQMGFGNKTLHVYLTKNLTHDAAYQQHKEPPKRRRTNRKAKKKAKKASGTRVRSKGKAASRAIAKTAAEPAKKKRKKKKSKRTETVKKTSKPKSDPPAKKKDKQRKLDKPDKKDKSKGKSKGDKAGDKSRKKRKGKGDKKRA